MEPTPLPASLRTVLIVAAAVLGLVGLGGIVTGAGDKDADDLSTAGASRTTTTFSVSDSTFGPGEDSTPTTTGAAAGTATTAGRGATGTTRPGASGPTTTVATVATNACDNPPETSSNPGALAPIPTGGYSYVSCTNPAESQDTTVRAGADGGGKVRRLRTASRQGLQLTENLAFGSDGAIQESLEIVAFGQTIRCDWNPDVLQYPADLSVGKQWTGKSACTTQYGRFSVDGSGKVIGRRVVTLGGVQIPTWVIESRITFTSPQGNVEEQGVHYFDPTRALDLFSDVTATSQGETVNVKLRLASLTPRPA